MSSFTVKGVSKVVIEDDGPGTAVVRITRGNEVYVIENGWIRTEDKRKGPSGRKGLVG